LATPGSAKVTMAPGMAEIAKKVAAATVHDRVR
jgi:hypothetical protein